MFASCTDGVSSIRFIANDETKTYKVAIVVGDGEEHTITGTILQSRPAPPSAHAMERVSTFFWILFLLIAALRTFYVWMEDTQKEAEFERFGLSGTAAPSPPIFSHRSRWLFSHLHFWRSWWRRLLALHELAEKEVAGFVAATVGFASSWKGWASLWRL